MDERDELQTNPALDRFVRDERSPLEQMLGTQTVPHQVVEGFEGAGGRFAGKRIAVRALSAHERVQAFSEAFKFLTRECGFEREDLYVGRGAEVLDFEAMVRALAFGLVVPAASKGEQPRQLVKNADEVRRKFEDDEINVLFNHLIEYSASRSPLQASQSWEEVEGFLTALGKGLASKTSLSRFAVATLRFMLHELACRHFSPTKPSSSDTSTPSDSGASSSTSATDPTP